MNNRRSILIKDKPKPKSHQKIVSFSDNSTQQPLVFNELQTIYKNKTFHNAFEELKAYLNKLTAIRDKYETTFPVKFNEKELHAIEKLTQLVNYVNTTNSLFEKSGFSELDLCFSYLTLFILQLWDPETDIGAFHKTSREMQKIIKSYHNKCKDNYYHAPFLIQLLRMTISAIHAITHFFHVNHFTFFANTNAKLQFFIPLKHREATLTAAAKFVEEFNSTNNVIYQIRNG